MQGRVRGRVSRPGLKLELPATQDIFRVASQLRLPSTWADSRETSWSSRVHGINRAPASKDLGGSHLRALTNLRASGWLIDWHSGLTSSGRCHFHTVGHPGVLRRQLPHCRHALGWEAGPGWERSHLQLIKAEGLVLITTHYTSRALSS